MKINSMKLQIIIPVYKPDEKIHLLLQGIKNQSIKDIPILIIDSGSDKGYLQDIADVENADFKDIKVTEFNHGLTRQMGIDLFPERDIYIFFTQDAVPANEKTIENIVKVFDNKQVGCAYGRQLPNADATIFAKFSRLYNYGDKSYVRSYEDRKKYGIKTVFISDSFAAYRQDAIVDIGGFPDTNMSEDMYVAAKMLLNGWKIAYQADACVYHSHNLSIKDETQRYVQIGAFQKQNKWIEQLYGKAERSGMQFLKEELIYVIKNEPCKIFDMIFRDLSKYIAYKMN